jgi:hypothetical protein
MPKEMKHKLMVARNPLGLLLENLLLLFWLILLYTGNKINMLFVKGLLRHNKIDMPFSDFIDNVSSKAVESNENKRQDLLFFGYRALTVRVVVEPRAMEEAGSAPLRSQFQIPSALLDGYGRYSFLHKTKMIEYAQDKAVFRRCLQEEAHAFDQKMQEHFNAELDLPDQWGHTPVKAIIRRVTFYALAEAFLGLKKTDIAPVYDKLTQSLDTFEMMWQTPTRLNPFTMFRLYQVLEKISNQWHQDRAAAQLPDTFAAKYKRPMNLTAIFFVASNVVQLLTAAVIHTCSEQQLSENIVDLSDNLSKEVATWRFRDSRLFRVDDGIFYSKAPKYRIGGELCLPRTITIIPQGDINHKRILTNALYEDGTVKTPELFGRSRPCPGADTTYTAVTSVFKVAAARKLRFFPVMEDLKQYNAFINGVAVQQEQRGSDIPSVRGQWC